MATAALAYLPRQELGTDSDHLYGNGSQDICSRDGVMGVGNAGWRSLWKALLSPGSPLYHLCSLSAPFLWGVLFHQTQRQGIFLVSLGLHLKTLMLGTSVAERVSYAFCSRVPGWPSG